MDSGLRQRQRSVLRIAIGLVAVVVAVVLVGQFVPYFASPSNISKVLLEAAILSVAAFGMTLVIITGGSTSRSAG